MFKKCQIFLSYSIKTQEKFKTMNSINRKYLLIQTWKCYFDQRYLSCLKFKIILERKKKKFFNINQVFPYTARFKKGHTGIPKLWTQKLDSRRWTLDAGSWTLDAGSWTLDAGLFTLNSGLWALDSGRWTLDSARWILDARLWTLDSGCWTLDSGRWNLDAGPWRLHLGS